ncbi:hypothetical protein PO878_04720 [Iamia majanohamensis]|uniref:Uncharacterized protein n=1 Tax=Iamia majanohamensis TaxID=467976 RepID=A0AAE9Y929_9ACTN|nr:hypothetical protein [Iamia majanohamensis]WCO68026.1 hypothetical protein PO878_04720 [Iamia majanohamensis]
MAVTTPGFPVPVFAASAGDAWGEVQELRARPEIRLVPSPRQASVLLVAGAIPSDHAEAVDRVHDQLPHPRATVRWRPRPAGLAGPEVVVDGGPDEVVAAIVAVHLTLSEGGEASEPDRNPDQEPNEWRGVGPNGQGGEGMMGGTPYGRPMAMTGDDRDGLALDQLHLRFGPFLDALPAGLVLDVTLQGDVLQKVSARRSDPTPEEGVDVDPGRQGLRWLAHALHVQGLDALAAQAADLACDRSRGRDVGVDLRRLRRRIRRSGLLWMLRQTGVVDGDGDAADRWSRRLDAIEAAVGDAVLDRSPPTAVEDLDELLKGKTLGDAVTTIVSLDLDTAPMVRGAAP